MRRISIQLWALVVMLLFPCVVPNGLEIATHTNTPTPTLRTIECPGAPLTVPSSLEWYRTEGIDLGPSSRSCWFLIDGDEIKKQGVLFHVERFDIGDKDTLSFKDPSTSGILRNARHSAVYTKADPPANPKSVTHDGPVLVQYDYGGPSDGTGFSVIVSLGYEPDLDPDAQQTTGDSTSSGNSGGSGLGLIVLPAIIAVVLVIILIAVFMWRMKKHNAMLKEHNDAMYQAQSRRRLARFSQSSTHLDTEPSPTSPGGSSFSGVAPRGTPPRAPVSSPQQRHAARDGKPPTPVQARNSAPIIGTGRPPPHPTPSRRRASVEQSDSAADGRLTRESSRASSAPSSQGVQIPPQDVILGRELGRGSFGSVHAGVFRGTEVAVKLIPVVSDEHYDAFRHEMSIMLGVRHPNCITMMGVLDEVADHPGMSGLVMERAVGTVADVISTMSLPRAVNLALGIARGMAYLHGRKIVHRDLKSQNVLVDVSGTPRVSDFGLSRVDESVMSTSVGTPYTMAPEVIKHHGYGPPADVYSFSIVLWQLLARDVPYKNMNAAQVVFLVGVSGNRPDIPPGLDPRLTSLLTDCWADDPADRPTFEEVIPRLVEIQTEFGGPPQSSLLKRKARRSRARLTPTSSWSNEASTPPGPRNGPAPAPVTSESGTSHTDLSHPKPSVPPPLRTDVPNDSVPEAAEEATATSDPVAVTDIVPSVATDGSASPDPLANPIVSALARGERDLEDSSTW